MFWYTYTYTIDMVTGLGINTASSVFSQAESTDSASFLSYESSQNHDYTLLGNQKTLSWSSKRNLEGILVIADLKWHLKTYLHNINRPCQVNEVVHYNNNNGCDVFLQFVSLFQVCRYRNVKTWIWKSRRDFPIMTKLTFNFPWMVRLKLSFCVQALLSFQRPQGKSLQKFWKISRSLAGTGVSFFHSSSG